MIITSQNFILKSHYCLNDRVGKFGRVKSDVFWYDSWRANHQFMSLIAEINTLKTGPDFISVLKKIKTVAP